DVEVGSWYEPYVYYAYEQGWIAGYPDGNFRPLSIVNIAEAAKIILSSKNVSTVNSSGPWYQPYVQYLLEKNIFQLSSAGYAFSFSDDGFPAHSEASRAQIAAFLSRLIFISEHQSLPVYARLTESSLLAFQLTSETPLEVYDLGNAVHGPYHNVYSLFVRDGQGLNPVMDLALIEPDVWSQLDIAEAPTDLPAMTYLAEDGHFVIAVFDSCLFQKPCLQATARQLSETLVVSNQMLSSFRDPNSSYSFLHPPNFRVRFQSSASEQTAIITSEAGREHMILSLLPGRAGEIGTFQGLSPVESRKLGKRDWVIYHQQASVLLLSVVSSRDLLVAQIPLESTGVRLDPLLYQILRTVREK
ncbi:MAG: S-layer homology domain-containing protein, partial [bacterium]|nr:S-layer homology domain-containing protein [bacterium]